MKSEDKIKYNIKVHNRLARKYEKVHDEIFNDVEQTRIRSAVAQVVEAVNSGKRPLQALDVGCGSGNLTRHLIDLGFHTVSADVSDSFLNIVRQRFAGSGLSETVKINGNDLANIKDCTFDVAAAYSVLHHVPNYLHLVKEMCRVLQHGGVLYLDHETNESYYYTPEEYTEFLKLSVSKSFLFWKYLRLLLSFRFYIHFIRKRANPRYQSEGDIHVWPDDHIKWDKIEQLLASEGFEIVARRDYLLYKKSYRKNVYEQYKDKCSDMTMLTARKK